MNKVIILDDDLNYARVLADMLSCHDLAIECCSNYQECQIQINNADDDVVILMSFFLNGKKQLDLIHKILEDNNIKLIILSDSDDDKDEVACLKAGVGDYIRKHVSYSVIFERLKRVSKTMSIKDNQFQYTIKTVEGVIEINTTNNLVTFNGKALHLTQLEFDLLLYFIKNKNKILTRDLILKDVWKLPVSDSSVDTRTIDVHVKNLRRKLKLKTIYSIRGVGYRWYE